MSTLAVVEQILRETRVPMSVKGIVEHAGDSLPTKSKTPDTVVARDLSMDLKRKGDESIFIRTSPGRYTMREFVTNGLVQLGDGHDGSAAVASREDAATPMLSKAMPHGRAPTRPAEPLSKEGLGSEPSLRKDSEGSATV